MVPKQKEQCQPAFINRKSDWRPWLYPVWPNRYVCKVAFQVLYWAWKPKLYTKAGVSKCTIGGTPSHHRKSWMTSALGISSTSDWMRRSPSSIPADLKMRFIFHRVLPSWRKGSSPLDRVRPGSTLTSIWSRAKSKGLLASSSRLERKRGLDCPVMSQSLIELSSGGHEE